MQIYSVNVSKMQTIPWRGHEVKTGIFKEPVEGKVWVNRNTLMGDVQADLSVHGGENKAVYAYSLENYQWWKQNKKYAHLKPGAFGENLTISNFNEEKIHIGDVFQIGETVLQAVQPRFPCYKLGIKFGDQGIIKKFMESRRLGIYFRVIKEGNIQRGDTVNCLKEDPEKFPVQELAFLFSDDRYTIEDYHKVIRIESLEENWRQNITEKLAQF